MRLYLLPLAEAARLPEAYCKAHFPQRTARASRFRHEADTLRCLGAGALFYGVLGIAEAALQVGAWGKPFVPGAPGDFSLSHSGDWILLATDTGTVGADVEQMDARHLSVAERVLQPKELEWMQADPETRFFRLWTMKESVIKATGKGLTLEPASFSALELLSGASVIVDGLTLWGQSLLLPGHAVALCGSRPFSPVEPKIVTAEALLAGADGGWGL